MAVGIYYGKILVTKVSANSFAFDYVVYNSDGSINEKGNDEADVDEERDIGEIQLRHSSSTGISILPYGNSKILLLFN